MALYYNILVENKLFLFAINIETESTIFLKQIFFYSKVSDPVAAHFSLNTNFYLLSKKSLYMSDGSMGFAEDSDAAFVEGKYEKFWFKN